MVSQLESAMDSLIQVFHTYSTKEGDKYKLSKAEMKSLLQGELSDFLAASKDPQVVDKIMSDLDENRDGEVDFQEFVVLVAALTVAYHHCIDMASQLENAMETLIKVFHTYSSKEGDKYKLSKAELKSLLQGELSVYLA
ncbi:uncharacterized protein DAT39_002546, partial [Clarias magur]